MHTPEIFISYAWKDREQSEEDSREHIVNEVCAAFEKKGHRVIRDKTDVAYRESIAEFMERIGEGAFVIVVISDKYLRSDFCMFEAREMMKHKSFRERVFPIVLDDADIFSDNAIDYTLFWQKRKQALSEKIDETGRRSNSAKWIERERRIEEISLHVDNFITHIADLNVLSPQMHFERNFSDIVDAIDAKINSANGSPSEKTATAPATKKRLPPVDLSDLDLSHALRPEFTKNVLLKMLGHRSQSVNLIGKRGTGRRRLLTDMVKCKIPDVKVVQVNMQNFVSSYAGFLDDVAHSLGVEVSSHRFTDLMEKAFEKKPRHYLLCLDHFEAISDETHNLDEKYDTNFLNQLNALRNTCYARLLCVTFEPHSRLNFKGVSSWLDLEKIYLPESVSEKQISTEIKRYRNDLPNELHSYLVQQVETEPDPLCLLGGLQSMLPGAELRLDKMKDMVKSLKRNLGGYGK